MTEHEPPKSWLNRDFLLLWQGQWVSRLGDQAFLIALMFWTKEASDSTTVMGLMMVLSTLPGVLLGPLGGAFADRHSRKAIIVGADLIRGVGVLALAFLLFRHPDETGLILIALFTVALTMGIVGSVFSPTISAVIPDLVPRDRVAAANSLNRVSAQIAVFVGQALGGVLYRFLGAPLLFLIDGVSYILSACSEAFIRVPPHDLEPATPEPRVDRYLREAKEGLVWVWERRGMRAFLLVAAGINFFAMLTFILIPYYTTDYLAVDPEAGAAWYGFLLSAMGAGAVVGYVVAGSAPWRGETRMVAGILALLGTGGFMAAVAPVRDPTLALLLFAGMGLCSGVINILVVTLFQLSTPSRMRGRVMGLVLAMSTASVPLGVAMGGILGDATGKDVPLLYFVSGVAVLLITLAAAANPSFRSFLSQSPDDPPESPLGASRSPEPSPPTGL